MCIPKSIELLECWIINHPQSRFSESFLVQLWFVGVKDHCLSYVEIKTHSSTQYLFLPHSRFCSHYPLISALLQLAVAFRIEVLNLVKPYIFFEATLLFWKLQEDWYQKSCRHVKARSRIQNYFPHLLLTQVWLNLQITLWFGLQWQVPNRFHSYWCAHCPR